MPEHRRDRHVRTGRAASGAVDALVVALVGATSAFAAASASTAETAGTPKQVAALVAAAPSIKSLPSDLTPSIGTAASDTALISTPGVAFCDGGGPQTHCTFGDRKGSKTMVLIGDSHAFMWFPAINAIAKADKWKLVFLSLYGCPVAALAVWFATTNSPYTACPKWRAATIARINKLDPALVIVAETHYTENAHKSVITNAQWQRALEVSLNALDAKHMHKVLISDTVAMPKNPVSCLAANPKAVQKCSVPEANKVETAERATDVAAAKATNTLYVNEIPWECSKTCTAVIGKMVVYYWSQHLTATYDAYLAGVFKLAIAADLR